MTEPILSCVPVTTTASSSACTSSVHTGVKRMRSLASARQHAQHTNTHWPTFQLNKSWQIKPKTQPNEQYKQPLTAGIKGRTLALPFVREYLFNWGPKYFLLQDFYKGTDNKVTPCDLQKKEEERNKNFTLPLAQTKRLQITCRWDVRVVLSCFLPPRTPKLCLCKHTLKVMYIICFVLHLNWDSKPLQLSSLLCSSGPIALHWIYAYVCLYVREK